MKNIITILDNITETSMPFNEFVIYRANHYAENHFLIICSNNKTLPNIKIPKNVNIFYVGKNIFKIRKTIFSIIKIINTKKESYVIHTHQPKSALLFNIAMIFSGQRNRELYTIHSTFSGYAFRNKIICFLNCLFSKRITCVSNTSYKYVPKIIKLIKKDRIIPLENGVDIQRINDILVNEEKIENNNLITFIYVARLIPIKNHELIIKAIKNVLEFTNIKIKVIFVGSGELENKLKQLVKSLKIEKYIEFKGLIPRVEVFKLLNKSDFYLSSSTLEGLPISVMEAMYCGLPCILSKIEQHEELVGKSDFVRIVDFDVEQWKDEIIKCINLSKKEKNALGIKCKKYIINNFSLEKMHEKYSKIYDLI